MKKMIILIMFLGLLSLVTAETIFKEQCDMDPETNGRWTLVTDSGGDTGLDSDRYISSSNSCFIKDSSGDYVVNSSLVVSASKFVFKVCVNMTGHANGLYMIIKDGASGVFNYQNTGNAYNEIFGIFDGVAYQAVTDGHINSSTNMKCFQIDHNLSGGVNCDVYVDEVLKNEFADCEWNSGTPDTIEIHGTGSNGANTVYFDDVEICNDECDKILRVPDISNINCTSGEPKGDTFSPYYTNVTTPSFDFVTDINSNCSCGINDWNYTDMGYTRLASGGQGTKAHTCTIISGDALNGSTDQSVYISCINIDLITNQTISSTSGRLVVNYLNTSNVFDFNLDGKSEDRTYEFDTTAELVGSLNACKYDDCTVCLDIFDDTGRYLNYSCTEGGVSFDYKLDVLRINEFNDFDLIKNVSAEIVYVRIDNRTDIADFVFNISGIHAGNVTINLFNESFVITRNLITGREEFVDKFLYVGSYHNDYNISFITAESKTIYLNVSAHGIYKDRKSNLSFIMSAFSLDTENEFEKLNEFNLIKNLPSGNVTNGTTEFGTYENFLQNISAIFGKINYTGWTGETIDEQGIGDYGGINSYEKCNQIDGAGAGGPNYGGEDYDNCFYAYRKSPADSTAHFYFSELDFREIGAFSMNINLWSKTGYGGDGTTSTILSFSDIGTDINLISCTAVCSGTCRYSPSPNALDCYYNITGQKVDDNTWNISYTSFLAAGQVGVGGDSANYSGTFSISPLSKSRPLRIKLKTAWSGSVGGADNFNYVRVNFLNVSGVSLKRSNNDFIDNGSYISDLLNETDSNITKMIVNASFTGNVTISLSINNGSIWEKVTNGETHTFSMTGNMSRIKFDMYTKFNHTSPIVYNYRVSVVPTTLEGLTIQVGNNDSSMDLRYVLNSSTTPVGFNGTAGDVNQYLIDSNASSENQTFMIPIIFTSSSGGLLQITSMNLSHDINPVNFSFKKLDLERLEEINFSFNYSGTNLTVDDIRLDFLGSKNITVKAKSNFNQSRQENFSIFVKYSPFNLTFPSGENFWQIFPNKRNQSHIIPYGQNSSHGIWEGRTTAYEDDVDIYVRYNESLDSCVFENKFSGHNFSVQNGTQAVNVSLTTTLNVLVDSISSVNVSQIFTYTMINCSGNTLPFEIALFCFSSKCDDCVYTNDFSETCEWVE